MDHMNVLKTPTKTPAKPIELGSPQSSLKPIPHVVFLIDPKSIDVKVIVVRILLLFHIHVNPLFTWGYEIVNYDRELKGKRLGVSKHDFGLSHQALQQLAADLDIAQSSNHDNLKYMLDLIQQVSIQAQWNYSIASHLQSPLKKQSKPARNIKIRNYLFILSPLPKTMDEFNRFLLQENLQLDHLLEIFHQDFLSLDMWNYLIQERISLYWINSDMPSTNEIVTRTESWLSNALKLYGGRYLDYYLLYSPNLRHLWKNCLKMPSIDGQVSQMYFRQDGYSLFLESFDKVYFNVGSIKFPIIKSLDLDVPRSMFPFACAFNVKTISNPHKLDIFELETYHITGWTYTSIADYQCFVVPDSSNLENVNSFNVFQKFCCCNGVALVLSDGSSTAILQPLMPNLAFLTIADDVHVQTGPIPSNINLIQPYNISVWYSLSFPDYLQEFLKSGVISPNSSAKLTQDLMGMFELKESRVKLTPQKPVRERIEKEQASESNPTLPSMKDLVDFYDTFEYFYYCILYEKIKILLEYFTSKIVRNMSDLDTQSKMRVDSLSFLYSKSNSDMPFKLQTLAQTWFLKQKQKVPAKSELKLVLKKALRDLAITDMETSNEIPTTILFKTPKKSKNINMNDHFEKYVENLLDRIMISSISLDLDNESSCYYSSLPEICDLLKSKSGGNLEGNEEPFSLIQIAQKPKKRRVKEEEKPPVAVQKAPSKLAQMRRQVISTKKAKSKSGSRKLTRTVSLSDFRKPLDSNNTLGSPVNAKSVYIPETPVKPRHIDFLQSPSKRSRKNFKDILATPNK
ncbi:hypothetical protein HDV01_006619 [Terramyces sp. JEL0728]|nr:hypothetical protein HDV01_006619 [Terramyces sp. JEL0728]